MKDKQRRKKALKIIHIGAHDTGGSGFFSSQAVNNHSHHLSVNIRFVNDWARIPAYIWANRYPREAVRNMLYKADVIHFQIHTKPFFTSLGLDPKIIQKKKTLVWYHGTLLRTQHRQLLADAKEYLPDHVACVSTPDLFAHIEQDREAYWLPVPRDFNAIIRNYGFNAKEEMARHVFGKKKVITIGHPSSSVGKKGSKFFFAVLTDIMRFNKNLRSTIVINTPWDACMRKYSEFDMVLGAAAGAGTYGLTCVEAAAFKIPAITLMTETTVSMYKKLVGESPPIVMWHDMKDLFHKLQEMSSDLALRTELGQSLYDWMKPLHDYPEFARNYLNIITRKK